MSKKLLIDLTNQENIEIINRKYTLMETKFNLSIVNNRIIYTEYYPLWETLQMTNKSDGFLKICLTEYDVKSGQLNSSDMLWFNLTVDDKSVEAVCQIFPHLHVILM